MTSTSACDYPESITVYADEVVSQRISVGRMCDDPVGAAIAVETTMHVTCIDEERCGRDFGTSESFTFTIDGGEPEVFELAKGGDMSWPESCVDWFSGSVFGFAPEEGESREIGQLTSDCRVRVDRRYSGTERFSLELMRTADVTPLDPVNCETEGAYSAPRLTALRVTGELCSDGATLDFEGDAVATCQSAGTCNEGDEVSLSFDLPPFAELGDWPSASTSDGGSLHVPWGCEDFSVELVDAAAEPPARIPSRWQGCTLTVDAADLSAATSPSLHAFLPGFDDVRFEAACSD